MTSSIAPFKKSSIVLPLAVGAALVFVVVQSFAGPSTGMANLRYCDDTVQAVPAADIAQTGKIRTQDSVVTVAAPATVARARVTSTPANTDEQAVNYARCLPPPA